MRVDLIYDMDCPNLRHAREALLKGFSEAGLQPSWTEWDRKLTESPAYARLYGSPTILVDGRDVAGAEPVEGSDSCRIYDHRGSGVKGVPPVQGIAAALGNAGRSTPTCPAGRGRGWWRFLGSAPGVGAALLPVGVCPACWPAYAGIVGFLGLGLLLESTYLLPITIGFLGLAVFTLGVRAKTRRGYRPLALGIASVACVLVFKSGYVFDALMYAGLFGLVVASVWDAWPKRKTEVGSCPKCVQPEPAIGNEERTVKGGAAMATQRKIEVFSAGCPACDDTVQLVHWIACPSCDVSVLDMNDPAVARRAEKLGVRSVPAVVIDGKLADCCSGREPEAAALRAAEIGQAI